MDSTLWQPIILGAGCDFACAYTPSIAKSIKVLPSSSRSLPQLLKLFAGALQLRPIDKRLGLLGYNKSNDRPAGILARYADPASTRSLSSDIVVASVKIVTLFVGLQSRENPLLDYVSQAPWSTIFCAICPVKPSFCIVVTFELDGYVFFIALSKLRVA